MSLLRTVVCLTCMFLVGCGALIADRKGTVIVYAPNVTVASNPALPSVSWSLVVTKPEALPLIDSPRIAVRPVASQLMFYKGVSWAAPGTNLVEHSILDAFEDSGRIKAVGLTNIGMRSDYKLVLELRHFESEYTNQTTTPSVRIELSMKLINSRTQEIIATHVCQVRQPARSAQVDDVVSAFSQAIGQISSQVVEWTLISGQRDAANKPSIPVFNYSHSPT